MKIFEQSRRLSIGQARGSPVAIRELVPCTKGTLHLPINAGHASSPWIRERVFKPSSMCIALMPSSVALRSITTPQHDLQKQDPSFPSQPQLQRAITHDVGLEITHTNSSALSDAPDQNTFLTRITLASVNSNPATESAPRGLLRAPSCRQDVRQLVSTLFLPMTGLIDFTHDPMATKVSSRTSHMRPPILYQHLHR